MRPSNPQHPTVAVVHCVLLVGALVLAFGFPLAGWAQPPAPPKAGLPAAAAPGDLRAVLEARYEILPGHGDGVVLKPRTEELGVRTIEVSGASIAVNGERVSEGVLRAWLGEQADPIVRLWRLPAAERQAAVGLKSGGAAGEREIPDTASSTASAAEETPAASEAAETAAPETPEAPEPPQPPAPPEPPSSSSGSRVKVGGGITVDKDELAEQAVSILGSVHVDGETAQDAVAVLGSVFVNGKVGGNVVAVGGSVHLGPHAEVMGDVTSVGGSVDREEGAKVHGGVQEVGMAGGRHWHRDVDIDWGWGPWGFFSASMDLFWKLISLAVLALLVFLCLLIARRQVEAAEYHVAVEPWKAGIVGFLAQLLFLPMLVVVTILLAITIVGCALFLLYPFLFVALALAALLGYAAVAHRLGRALENRFDRRFGSPYAVALMGVVTIEIWGLFGRMVALGGGVLHLLALLILAFGFAVQYAAWTVGIGAIILSSLNRTRPDWEAARLPAPPPPSAPPGSPAALDRTASLPLSERWEEPRDERRWEDQPDDRTER